MEVGDVKSEKEIIDKLREVDLRIQRAPEKVKIINGVDRWTEHFCNIVKKQTLEWVLSIIPKT
jgi:hypothetical protein